MQVYLRRMYSLGWELRDSLHAAAHVVLRNCYGMGKSGVFVRGLHFSESGSHGRHHTDGRAESWVAQIERDSEKQDADSLA